MRVCRDVGRCDDNVFVTQCYQCSGFGISRFFIGEDSSADKLCSRFHYFNIFASPYLDLRCSSKRRIGEKLTNVGHAYFLCCCATFALTTSQLWRSNKHLIKSSLFTKEWNLQIRMVGHNVSDDGHYSMCFDSI